MNKQEIALKKMYDEVTEDIFDISNVGFFIEIVKKLGDVVDFVISSVS